MMRKFGHGHSLAIGVLLGLLLSQHVFVVAFVSLCVGAALALTARRAVRFARMFERYVSVKVHRAAFQRDVRLTHGRSQTDRIPY